MSQQNYWKRLRSWLYVRIVAHLLPEEIKRYVLYELADRARGISGCDEWSITFEQMYNKLKDI